MAHTYTPGQRVQLRPDRAAAYNLPYTATYTVARTYPHKRFARTWVVLAEIEAAQPGYGVVDSREVRPA